MVREPSAPAYSTEVEQVLTGAALLGEPYNPEELPNVDLFAITPEMAAFAERAVRRQDSYFERIKALHVAMLTPRDVGLGLVYSAYTTEVPTVSYAQRRVNCLSFTLLYIALAKHVGIQAQVNEVHIPPTWDLRDTNDMVFLRHVNVRVPMVGRTTSIMRNDDVIIDLEMNRYRATYEQHTIDDDAVAAQYYSNRGVEFLANNKDAKNSFLYLRKAISLSDQQSYVWSNLGALYSRFHLLREAEVAYLQGLRVNPDDLTIMNNLVYLYRQTGDDTAAGKYSKLAQRYRDSNPYYQYNLALSAVEDKQYEQALLLIKRAIEREKNDLRFYELSVTIYENLHNTVAANTMRDKVKKLKAKAESR